jgi:hypothetical protein
MRSSPLILSPTPRRALIAFQPPSNQLRPPCLLDALLHKLPVPISGLPCPIFKLLQDIMGILPLVSVFPHQHAVAAEAISVQRFQIGYSPCTQRIKLLKKILTP